MLGSTLQLRPGLTLHKVALDWGQPKLLYVKPISSPLGLSCFYIFYEYSFGEIFLQNFIFWPKKMFDKIFFATIFFSENCFTKFFGKNFLGANFFRRKFCVLFLRNFYKCHCDCWNMFKMVPGTYLKFGQNRVRNRGDIPDMDKCRQDKCCLDKSHCDS